MAYQDIDGLARRWQAAETRGTVTAEQEQGRLLDAIVHAYGQRSWRKLNHLQGVLAVERADLLQEVAAEFLEALRAWSGRGSFRAWVEPRLAFLEGHLQRGHSHLTGAGLSWNRTTGSGASFAQLTNRDPDLLEVGSEEDQAADVVVMNAAAQVLGADVWPVVQELVRCGGNCAEAARELNVSRQSVRRLRRRLARYGWLWREVLGRADYERLVAAT